MHELYFRFSGDVDLCNGMAVSGNDDDHSDGGDYEDGYGDSIWRSTAPQDVHRRRARTHCNRSGLQLLSNITCLPWRKSGSPIFKRVFRVADFCGNFGFADLQAVAKNSLERPKIRFRRFLCSREKFSTIPRFVVR